MTTTRRSVIGALGAALTAVRAKAGAAGHAGPDLAFVAPELRPFAMATIERAGADPELSTASLPALRGMLAATATPPSPSPAVARRLIPSARGGVDVPVYLINSDPGSRRPAIVHMHGGGFVAGSAAASVGALQPLAAALDCVVMTIEYRLAPDTTFRGSIEDNYAALAWLYRNASALGVDPGRIAVMGESAGGGHAALLAIAARDRGEVPLILQALTYPMLDDRTGSGVLPRAPMGTILWTAGQNRFGWRSFLGLEPGGTAVPPAAVPARLLDPAGLPPAFVGVGTINLFLDEDVTYARRLADAGVGVELLTVPGAFHGFDGIASATAVARRFVAARTDALRRAFARPG